MRRHLRSPADHPAAPSSTDPNLINAPQLTGDRPLAGPPSRTCPGSTRSGRQGLRGEALRAADRVGVGLVGLAAERREVSSSRSASGTGDGITTRLPVARICPEIGRPHLVPPKPGLNGDGPSRTFDK